MKALVAIAALAALLLSGCSGPCYERDKQNWLEGYMSVHRAPCSWEKKCCNVDSEKRTKCECTKACPCYDYHSKSP
jgi:hypothetical protein